MQATLSRWGSAARVYILGRPGVQGVLLQVLKSRARLEHSEAWGVACVFLFLQALELLRLPLFRRFVGATFQSQSQLRETAK